MALVGALVTRRPPSRQREIAHRAFTSMRWATVRHANYTIASAEVLAALEWAYAQGYAHCRSDAAQVIGELLPEHELPLDE